MDTLDPRNCFKKPLLFCDESSIAIKVIATIVILLIVFSSIFGNLLVMISILFIPRLKENVTNLFLFSLALSDLLHGTTVLPYYLINYIFYCGCWHYGFVFCKIFLANHILFLTTGMIHLFCISINRYNAINNAYKYYNNHAMNRKKFIIIIIIIIIAWIFSILAAHIPIHTNMYISNSSTFLFKTDSYYCDFHGNVHYCVVYSTLTFFMPAILMCVIYYRIFQILHEQKRVELLLPNKESTITNNYTTTTTSSYTNTSSMNNNTIIDKSTSDCSQTKSNRVNQIIMMPVEHYYCETKTLCITMACFLTCWFGYFIIYLLINVFEVKPSRYLVEMFFIIGYLNTFLKPVIYVIYNKELKEAFKYLLTCLFVSDQRAAFLKFKNDNEIYFLPNSNIIECKESTFSLYSDYNK